MTDIAKIDEKQAVMEAFSPLCELLPEFVRDCTANIKKDPPRISVLAPGRNRESRHTSST